MQEEIVVKAPTTEALTPAQITQKAEDLGVTKTEMSFRRSFALSIMAGAFIAMGAMFFSLVVGDPARPSLFSAYSADSCSALALFW